MKFVRILRENVPVWGVVRGDQVRTLSRPPFEELEYDGRRAPLPGCRLLAPCTPTKIVCVGKNYADHAREMGSEPPEQPVLFIKAPNTLNHPDGEVRAPSFVERLDYEGELGVVIRRRAKDVPAERVGEYVLGYSCLNDVTARDVQRMDGQWTRGKSMDGFCPVGPWVTDEVDPSDLAVVTRLNGQVRQSGRTSQLIHPVSKLIAFITASMTLEPGDLVATGTPAGVGPMVPGDVAEVEIQGIGVLRSFVR